MLQVLIADDYKIIRQEIKEILLEEFTSIAIKEVEDTDTLIENGIARHWDIIITDLSMPGAGGLEGIKQILKVHPEQRILVVSVNSPEQYIPKILRLGAYGFISKDLVPEKLIEAVKTILAGGKFFVP